MSLENDNRLSDTARELLRPGDGKAYTRLVVAGHASGAAGVLAPLSRLNAGNVLSVPAASREDAEALVAGLWLWHDYLDESHAVSQSLHSPTGSFWHAIMHRR